LRGIFKIILDTDWAERYNRRDKGKVWSQGMQREKVDSEEREAGSVKSVKSVKSGRENQGNCGGLLK